MTGFVLFVGVSTVSATETHINPRPASNNPSRIPQSSDMADRSLVINRGGFAAAGSCSVEYMLTKQEHAQRSRNPVPRRSERETVFPVTHPVHIKASGIAPARR